MVAVEEASADIDKYLTEKVGIPEEHRSKLRETLIAVLADDSQVTKETAQITEKYLKALAATIKKRGTQPPSDAAGTPPDPTGGEIVIANATNADGQGTSTDTKTAISRARNLRR